MTSVRPSPLDASSFESALQVLQQRIDQLQMAMTEQQKLATLGMVTAVIAHEFNNILTPMISYTTYALGAKGDAELKEKALQKALAGAQRAANISKSLLGFARGDESKAVEVGKAVKETLACLSRDPGKDGITLVVNVEGADGGEGTDGKEGGLWAGMNGGQLQQVLMNLIVNARAAMLGMGKDGVRGGRGAKRLTISARKVQGATGGGGGGVEISVADTGPGIDPEVLPRIFEPFFSTKPRVEGAGNEEEAGRTGGEELVSRGGTGLGLTICRELVTGAGGTIRVNSEVGKGAEFVVELPGGNAER